HRLTSERPMSRDKEPLSRRLTHAAFLVLLLPILTPLVVIGFVLFLLYRLVLYALVWMLWLPSGKDTLVIYSDSPIWHDYLTQTILPLVQERAMVLNWSERKKWHRWSLPVQIFSSFGGGYAFNPMVILFRPFRRAAVFRFWDAFKDSKRGYTEPVERLRNELLVKL